MTKRYHHLTYEQRCQIYALKKRGDSFSTIAEQLKVHRSTIYRELKRNRGRRSYRFKQAQKKALDRRSKASSHQYKMTVATIKIITEKIHLQWSPEQIAGYLKKERYPKAVSAETIYQYVWKNKKSGGVLYKHLRHNGKKYNKRRSNKAGRGCIPNRVGIETRPEIVEKKCRLGDWELDTIIGKGHQGAIVSIVDRASKLTKLAKVSRKTAYEVKEAILSKLSSIKEFVITLTADNGKEFANHQEIAKDLNSRFFFANPYHSWERGLNEHTNGLVRQYFPKSMAFDEMTQSQLDAVEFLLNNRPRKVLKYSTPAEVFNQLAKKSPNVALHN